MKKVLLAVCILGLTVSGAFAQLADVPVATKVVIITLQGTLIDNKSASEQKPQELAEFIKTYTKEIALKPECIASGYSIFSDGKLYKFDGQSNIRVETFLRAAGTKINVELQAQVMGEEIMMIAIKSLE